LFYDKNRRERPGPSYRQIDHETAWRQYHYRVIGRPRDYRFTNAAAAAQRPEPPVASHRPEPPVASLPPPVVKITGRILVIDDEEMILGVIGSMLNTLGFECAVAQDGVEGINEYVRAKADGHPFAAVLLDATIPNALSGEEALKSLLEADPDARVILCSGYSDSDLFKEADQFGFRAVLAKPFSISEFVSVLNKVLSSS
jgi:CheY-like chemotaxis protein